MLKATCMGLALAVCTVTFTLSPAIAIAGPNNTELRAEGTISSVDPTGGTVSLRKSSGAIVTVNVTAATKVERNGVRVPLKAIKIGDRGQFRYDSNLNATKVESVG